MKKKLINLIFLLLLIVQQSYSQQIITYEEDFDGSSISFTATPTGSWLSNGTYYLPSLTSAAVSKSYLGRVPANIGDTTILKSNTSYDFTGKTFVIFKFSHICKVSPRDKVLIQFKRSGESIWHTIDALWYDGEAVNYAATGFNAASYSQWEAGDSTVIPTQDWWRDEQFNLSAELGNAIAEIRFVIVHGSVPNTDASTGWLLENIQLIGSTYEIKEPTVEFTGSYPHDTVYSTGPFTVEATVKTTTQARIETPLLSYAATLNGTVIHSDVLTMDYVADDLWRVSIPQHEAGTTIAYTITGRDTTGNVKTIDTSFIILKRNPSGEYIVLQNNGRNDGVNSGSNPFQHAYGYSRSMSLYLSSEINTKGNILSVALRVYQAGSGAFPMKVWLKTVPESKTAWVKATDNYDWAVLTQDATLVYDGDFHFDATGWYDIPLQQSFHYNGTDNLVVMFEQNCGGNSCASSGHMLTSSTYYRETNKTDKYWYKATFGASPPTASTSLTVNAQRPDLRIKLLADEDNNSVALVSVNTDNTPIVAGNPTPIVTTITNKGVLALDSALITYTLNGLDTTTYKWYGRLPWDFQSKDTIGYYTPRSGMMDTIKAWVSMPNGVADNVVSDDTLFFVSYGCLEGNAIVYNIGHGTSIPTVAAALSLLETTCPPTGDVTFLIADGTYTGTLELQNNAVITNNYTLTITSASGHRDSVIIKSTTGAINPGVRLGNSYNIVIKDITLDATTGNAGVSFGAACTNITIRDCKILTRHSGSTSGTYSGIYKLPAAVVENIKIIHNEMDGGYAGVSFDGSSTTTQGRKNIVIDSNTITNTYLYGIYVKYAETNSVSYNTITTGERTPGTNFYGIWMERVTNGGNIFNNKILINHGNITAIVRGMYFYYIDSALVANNEVSIHSQATTTTGVYIDYPKDVYVYHNSVLTNKNDAIGENRAHYNYVRSAVYSTFVKNNIFVAQGGAPATTLAFYLDGTTSNINARTSVDYNNYHSSGTCLGYVGAAYRVDLPAWKSGLTGDIHSKSIRPSFVDSLVDLTLTDYDSLGCLILPAVNKDIKGYTRFNTTTMGCYDGVFYHDYDAKLVDILGLKDGLTPGENYDFSVVVQNVGRKTLHSIQLEWFLDGNTQGIIDSIVYLSTGEYDTLTIGTLQAYASGEHEIRIVINTINSVVDQDHSNDTLNATIISCASPLSGSITIGSSPTAQYSDISSALFVLSHCGLSGKLTLELEDGTFSESVDLSGITATANDTLELLSLFGNAIIETGNTGINMGNMDNVTIQDIQIDVIGKGIGIALGSGNNITIHNCRINLDTTIGKTLSAGNMHVGIYKPEGEVANNGRIVHNTIIGGYNGIEIYAGNNNTYGTDWICNNNAVSKACRHSVYMKYTDLLSLSDNVVTPMHDASYTLTQWSGFTLDKCNATLIQRNKVHGQGFAFENPCGMYFKGLNKHTTPAAIFNNEIMLVKTGTSSSSHAFVFDTSSANIYHNSIYVQQEGISDYAVLFLNTTYATFVRNNNIVAAYSYPVIVTATSTSTTLDYNNYYTAGFSLGQYKGTVVDNDINEWKKISGQDTHSVSSLPAFNNISQSLKIVDSFAYISCPVLPAVSFDIENTPRQYNLTAMGAYELIPASTPTVKHALVNWKEEFIENQTVQIELEVTNYANTAVNTIEFAYTVNGGIPVSYLWTATSPLASFANETITIGTFPATINTKVQVWITKVDNVSNALMDTVSNSFVILPIAEFVKPLVPDTIYRFDFDVYASIQDITGAPIAQPELNVQTIINGNYRFLDTIIMIHLGDNIYKATVSSQYYNSKIIYSLTVSDNIGNMQTIMDSTYLTYITAIHDTAIIGTGTDTKPFAPYSHIYNYSASRNYYRASEIDPRQKGVYIQSIAFYKPTTAASEVNDVSFYLEAVLDSTISTNGFLYPHLISGATLVWGSAKSRAGSAAGWITFELNTPFYLPPARNLLVYCNNENGNKEMNNSMRFAYTTQSINTSFYCVADGTSFPPVSTSPAYSSEVNGDRPNLRVATEYPSDFYQGHNLVISTLIDPMNTDNLCTPDSVPIKITVANLGEYDYDFTQNPLQIGIDIHNPIGHHYYNYNTIATGRMASGQTDTLVFMQVLPVKYAGTYYIKAWINSPIDYFPYDDTLTTQFTSGRIGLPIVEDFSHGIPFEFVSSALNGDNKWEYFQDTGFAIQPNFGTGMIRYAGTSGSRALLTTRQLDLYQASNPFVEFWYYHDPTVSDIDNSNTIISILVGGTPHPLGTINLRDGNGWTYYRYELDAYTSGNECLLIQFESRCSQLGSVQYIDYIRVFSDVEAAVSEIILTPIPALCQERGSDILVVIEATRSQSITFSDAATVVLDINGNIHTLSLQGKVLRGNSSDTLLLLSNVFFPEGTYTMKAHFGYPIDNVPANDTAKCTIDIRPGFDIQIHTISTQQDRISAEFKNKQIITVENTGNVDLPDIGFDLTVTASDVGYYFPAQATVGRSLAPTEVDTIEFDAYTVPWSDNYQIVVHGYLICDSVMLNKTFSEQEYVDMNDLYMVAIEKPIDDNQVIDTVGNKMEVKMKLKNRNQTTYNPGEVKVGILITDIDGNSLSGNPVPEELPYINGGEEVSYTFHTKYTVPSLEEYYLVVYIENVDRYAHNDTLKMERKTNYGVGISNPKGVLFTMEQNIPNPAQDNTIIKYSIPQDGEVLFELYTVSGQLLYSQKEMVTLGDHRIELNISDYAVGIYFYMMEYKGQRLTKRISIER